MRILLLPIIGLFLGIFSGCASTNIQPLTKSSFEVRTSADELCGSIGARRIVNRVAAAEVMQRGYDKFIFVNNQEGSRVVGGVYNYYGSGFGSWTASSIYNKALVVKIVDSSDSLSASAILRDEFGDNYKEVVKEKGITRLGTTCGDIK